MTPPLKNITLSARQDLIARARKRATAMNSTLNALFREWLEQLSGENEVDYENAMKAFRHIRAGRTFTRDEMNER